MGGSDVNCKTEYTKSMGKSEGKSWHALDSVHETWTGKNKTYSTAGNNLVNRE